MSKTVIPEGMLKAADKAIGEARLAWKHNLAERNGELWPNNLKYISIEAALHWLNKNAKGPDHRCIDEIQEELGLKDMGHAMIQAIAHAWQRRMFLESEPEIPEEIKDLLSDSQGKIEVASSVINSAVIEASRRGKASR